MYVDPEELLLAVHTDMLTFRRLAENTVDAYLRDLRQFVAFLDELSLPMASCTINTLREFLAHLKGNQISARSISRKISALKLFFQVAHERFQIPNTAQELSTPKQARYLPTYLSEKELTALFKVARQAVGPQAARNRLMIALLYATGMRISELTSLTTASLSGGFIRVVGKGSRERQIPIPESVQDLLAEYQAGRPGYIYIFSRMHKGIEKPISRITCWHVIKGLIAQIATNKNISPHSFRHSLATHLLCQGADLRSLQLLLGHQHINTVAIYTHLDTRQLKKGYTKKHPRR